MDFLKSCNLTNNLINNYSISNKDICLFYEFLTSHNIFSSNDLYKFKQEYLVSEWFKFLKQYKFQGEQKKLEYGGTVFRATFGEEYTLKQLAQSPLHFSKGSNGTGLYAATSSYLGKSYIKLHLTNRFLPYHSKIGNILKIDVSENAVILNKFNIFKAQYKLAEEISNMNISEELKNLFIKFLKLDVSIPAILLGIDIIYIPNGHLVVLNKDVLILPKNNILLQDKNLRVNLEKFRLKDAEEIKKVDEFLQIEKE